MDAAITSKPPVVSDAVHLVCDITCSNNHPMKILTSWPYIGLATHHGQWPYTTDGLAQHIRMRNLTPWPHSTHPNEVLESSSNEEAYR